VHTKLTTLAILVTCCATTVADDALPRTGICPDELRSFDTLLSDFVRDRGIPGASLAVVRDGKLVLARGYGFADRDEKRPVEPTSLFRIASISKPITAVAVLRLVETGKLRLEDRIDELLAPRPWLIEGATFDPRLRQITVHHLLRHTGGFDRDASFDPMFRSVEIAAALGVPPPAKPEHVIRYLWGRTLDFDPGARYAYSNFGYCVLGRAIEKASGVDYETFVRREVLEPLGIRGMRIGATLRSSRAAGEVTYYAVEGRGPSVVPAAAAIGEPVDRAYGSWYHESLDAHGGWIASAIDLARFARAFDDPEHCAVLRAESVEKLFERPPGAAGHELDGTPKDHFYACGWLVRPQGDGGRANHWHAGSLPGTETLLVRRHDRTSWVVLFNTRPRRDGAGLVKAIDPLLHRAADAVGAWPSRDLFAEYR